MLRWTTILLSLFGLAVGIYAVSTSREEPHDLPLARPASVNPYRAGVAALGIVEPQGRDVAIVAPEPALVTNVVVDVGDSVKAGQVLFELDTRTLQADLLRAQASVQSAQAQIDRWHALPRDEDKPPLEASVARARAILADRQEQLRLTEEAAARAANNPRDVSIARFAVQTAQAELARAEADLAQLLAGGWKPDLDIALANRAASQAEVDALRLLMDRMIVRAPRDGQVLRRNIDPGEFATTNSLQPAIILGDLSTLRIRAQVDEEDIALIASRDPARVAALARTRGSVQRDFPLTLVRIEPFARPKTDLSGSNVERVDTRVIDVLFDTTSIPANQLFPGQAVDVFIDVQQ